MSDFNEISKLEELMHKAAIFFDDEAIKESYHLIRSGMDLNAWDEEGRSLLGFCLSNKEYLDYVPQLIQLGADVNNADKEGKTPLMYLSYLDFEKYFDIVDMLLENGADVNKTDQLGETVLHKSIANEMDCHIVYKFLEKGAEVNHQNNEGLTPFAMLMKQGRNIDLAFLLRAYGADESIKDKQGKTALDHAKENGHENFYQKVFYVFSQKKIEEARKKVAQLKHNHDMQAVWNQASHMQEVWNQASHILNKELKKEPDSKESDLKEKDDVLKNLWLDAARHSDLALLTVLHEEEGIDVNYADPVTGNTALHESASGGYSSFHPAVLSYLIEKKANVNKQNEEGVTPLMFLCQNYFNGGGLKFMLFLSKNPNLNIQDKKGNSLLHYAVNFSREEEIKMMVQKGADVTIKNLKEETAKDIYQEKNTFFRSSMSHYQFRFMHQWLMAKKPVLVQKGAFKKNLKDVPRQNEGA